MCLTCNDYRRKISAAIDATRDEHGRPLSPQASEYRAVRVLLKEYHLHFDATHRPGGPYREYIQPTIGLEQQAVTA
jgi:hypothetical protein